jgi:hypothetical protein
MKATGAERMPVGAIVVTAVFAIELTVRSSSDVTVAAAAVFWGLAIALAPSMQALGMSNAPATVEVVALVAVLFIVLAFLETTSIIVLRGTTPRVRWIVRAVAAIVAVALLLFTPAAGPMRMF